MQLLNLKNKRVRTTLTSKITQEKKIKGTEAAKRRVRGQKKKKKKSKGTVTSLLQS